MDNKNKLSLHIIDALGPFVVHIPTNGTINWSKVPFHTLEEDNRIPKHTQQEIIKKFSTYVDTVQQLGYDSVSIDDLAHMARFSFYEESLQLLLNDYYALYKKLFVIATKHNMRIFVNTDYLFFNNAITNHLATNSLSPQDFYKDVLAKVMTDFPEIEGVILRVGENDGKDVTGPFLSKLLLQTPQQANHLLKQILPLFEQRGKTLIFRTWTVGAYKIGDLIWNPATYDAVFADIASESLIVSMKYGDTDFMRHLALSPLFFHGPHKKNIELQTRREWEGMGTYPSFVGWDYASYLEQLKSNDSVVGIHVWCQTGGWAKTAWSNITYGQNSSFWNELNTEVTIDITRGASVQEAIKTFCKRRNIENTTSFIQLLEHSEIAIKKGFYIASLAEQPLYFRRTRIPPLMWLTWDKIHIPAPVLGAIRALLPKPSSLIHDGEDAVEASLAMLQLAKTAKLPKNVIESIRFEHATLVLLADIRHYIAGSLPPANIASFNRQLRTYESTYPQHYAIPKLHSTTQRRLPKTLLGLIVRTNKSYRKRDKIIIATSPVQAKFIGAYLKWSRSHLKNQAMGFETLFK